MASCIQIEGMLQSYVDDEASSSERLLIEEHLKACVGCEEHLQTVRTTAATMFEVLNRDKLRDDFTDKVMAHLPDIPPAVSVNESLRLQAHNEKRLARKWFLTAVRLVPVVMPMILLILAGLLWAAWPTFEVDPAPIVGMILYSDGDTANVQTFASDVDVVAIGYGIHNDDVFATGAESQMLLGLAGPSQITVFENSSVEVVAEREIILNEGRVFFDVARDARRFRVHTPDGRITVFGTSFQVDIQNSGTEVTVVNGEVMVENESTFVRVMRNNQVLFNQTRKPSIRKNIDTSAYVREARAIKPDTRVEEQFLSRLPHSELHAVAPVSEQFFVLETGGRPVDALLLKWVPDPYTTSHAGYTVYVSDGSMQPLFKSMIPSATFSNKQSGEMHLPIPANVKSNKIEILHITIVPEMNFGELETTFTEVAAIGETS